MKKLRKKVVNGLAMGICCLGLSVTPMFTTTAHALTARIAFSDPTTSAGEEFKVTMKVISVDGGSIGDNSIVIKYDTSYLKFVDGTNATSYGDGTVRVAGKVGDNPYEFAYTLTFKALKQGETNIDVKSWGILDKDNNAASLDKRGSSKITISEAAAATTTAESSSQETTTTQETTTAQTTAETSSTAESSSASQSSETSSQKSSDASSSAQTSAAGETKAYSDADGIVIEGKKYTLAKTFDKSLLPENFDEAKYDYHGTTVAAGKELDGNLVVMYLNAEDGSGSLFFYNEATDTWMEDSPVTVAAKTVTPIPLDEGLAVPKGFEEATLDVNGKKIKGWVWATDKEHNYVVVYGMNKDGNKDFYRLDLKEMTIQRYFEDPAIDGNTADYADTFQQYKQLKLDYKKRGNKLHIAAGVAGIAILGFLYLAFRDLKSGKKKVADRKDTPTVSGGPSPKPKQDTKPEVQPEIKPEAKAEFHPEPEVKEQAPQVPTFEFNEDELKDLYPDTNDEENADDYAEEYAGMAEKPEEMEKIHEFDPTTANITVVYDEDDDKDIPELPSLANEINLQLNNSMMFKGNGKRRSKKVKIDKK